jgi:hypothetical protein
MKLLRFASTLLHRYEIVLPEGAEKPTTKILAPHSSKTGEMKIVF